MEQINIHEAKTNLSKLIAEGREVIIARYGQPVAKLIPIRPNTENRKPGSAKDSFVIPERFFDDLPADILESFEK